MDKFRRHAIEADASCSDEPSQPKRITIGIARARLKRDLADEVAEAHNNPPCKEGCGCYDCDPPDYCGWCCEFHYEDEPCWSEIARLRGIDG